MTAGGRNVRLHELLARPGVHILLDRDAAAIGTLPSRRPLVSVHRLTSSAGHGLTTVRPDGYIGLRTEIADAAQLDSWLGLILP